MTPQLEEMINSIISAEEMMRLIELNEMNKCHAEGLQGFKRLFRYLAMDRQKHSIMLQNHLVEYCHTEPKTALTYKTQTEPMKFVESLKTIYNKSKKHIDDLTTASKMAFDEGESYLGEYLMGMIKDQSKEAEKINRIIMDIKRENSDLNFISHELHEKMKKKEEKYHGMRV